MSEPSETTPEPSERLQVRVGKGDCPSPHSLNNKVGRILWAIAWTVLFRPSPRVFYGWRRMVLRWFGAKIGHNARIAPSVRIWAPWNLTVGEEASLGYSVDCYCVEPIRIGSHATVSQEAFLCAATHDVHDPHMGLVSAPIVIDDQAWVCARAFIAPGVHIGVGGVVGACAVATRDVAPWTIVVGNPARFLKQRDLRSSGSRP